MSSHPVLPAAGRRPSRSPRSCRRARRRTTRPCRASARRCRDRPVPRCRLRRRTRRCARHGRPVAPDPPGPDPVAPAGRSSRACSRCRASPMSGRRRASGRCRRAVLRCGQPGAAERHVDEVGIVRMTGHVVNVLVPGDRLAHPGPAAVVASQQSGDFGRHKQAVARDVRVAGRAGARRIRQEPLLMARNPRDAVELLPAPARVRAAIDACRLGTGELGRHEAECRRGQARFDALPVPPAVVAPEQPLAIGPCQQGFIRRMQRRDAVPVEPEGLKRSVVEPQHSVRRTDQRAVAPISRGLWHRPSPSTPVSTRRRARRRGSRGTAAPAPRAPRTRRGSRARSRPSARAAS